MKALANQALASFGVTRGLAAADAPAAWRLEAFLGRLAELSGGPATASLTLAFRLVYEAQKLGEPVAWILDKESTFFPPDAHTAGIDLSALPVICVRSPDKAPRAADQLVRSGAFGLVVLDLGAFHQVPIAVQTRLVGLARKYQTALLCLTEKPGDQPSLGSLVSFRADAVRVKRFGGRFALQLNVLKDKCCGEGWRHREVCRGVDGLC
jgi:recombination protein RecA